MADDLLNLLVDEGRVVRINESVVYDADAYREMVEGIVSTIREQGKINVGQVRTGSGPAASTLYRCWSTWTSSASPVASATTGC